MMMVLSYRVVSSRVAAIFFLIETIVAFSTTQENVAFVMLRNDRVSSSLMLSSRSSSIAAVLTKKASICYATNQGDSLDLGDWDESVGICNNVVLVGRIGANPEPRYLSEGKVVLSIGLAVKRQYNAFERKALKVKYGEEETDWHTLELWGKDAEFMAKYVTKGARIGVSGSLFIDSYVDKATGEERTLPKIKVEDFHILESRAEAALREGGSTGSNFGGARKGTTSPNNNSRPNISTGYSTKNDNNSFYADDDDDPFSAVGSGSFFN